MSSACSPLSSGIIAIAWPGVTVLALVILFAVYAFIDAGLQTARAFSSGTAGPVFGHLLLALIDLAAGVIALVWPGPTALVRSLITTTAAAPSLSGQQLPRGNRSAWAEHGLERAATPGVTEVPSAA